MSCLSGFGLTSLLDSAANYFDASLPVYYRYRNFDPIEVGEAVSEMGFTTSPNVSGEYIGGTTDLQLCPSPGIRSLTLKQLADAKAAGANLRSGAKVLSISQTWVASIQAKFGFNETKQVFIDPSVVGFVYDGLLLEIVSYLHNDMYGAIINWDVICNGNDIK